MDGAPCVLSASPRVAAGPIGHGSARHGVLARRPRISSWLVSARRRSPSVMTPASAPPGPTTQAAPSGRRVMAIMTSFQRRVRRHRGHLVSAVHRLPHREPQVAAELPAGVECPNSSGVKLRARISAMASASPMASAVTALAVGARLLGSASRALTEASSSTSNCAAKGDAPLPSMPIKGDWEFPQRGTQRQQLG